MNLTVELFFADTDPSLTSAIRATPDQKGWKFPVTREDDQLFFRTKLSGSLVLKGADFVWLKSHYDVKLCCAEVGVNVLNSCESGAYELFWPGYFLLSAVRWDFTACTATVQDVKSRDGYDALFRVWDKPVNVLAESNYSTSLQRYPFVAAYVDFYTWQPDANGQLQHVLPDGNAPGTGRGGTEHVYPRGMHWLDLLGKLVIDTCSGSRAAPMAQSIKSDFYESAIDPVTKRKAFQKIVLAGSDAKRPASVKPATVMNLTLKEVLEDLRSLHNVYWQIDEMSGRLRLEHYSWFAKQGYTASGAINNNLLRYPAALSTANNEQTDLDGLFGYEELVIENNDGSLFSLCRTGNVTYDEGCVVRNDRGEQSKNTLSVRKIWTNLYGGYRNPDTVPDDSLFLCDVMPPGTDSYYQSDLPQLAQADPSGYPGIDRAGLGPNGYQQAATLFVDYHRYGRSFSSGLVNKLKRIDGSYSDGQQMAMLSVRPTRYQENITIPLCCTDLPIKLSGRLKTNRFDHCQLRQASFDPDAETLTLTVEAESRCSASLVVITPPDPGSDCPKAGTLLETRNEQTYCDQNDRQEIVATTTLIRTYADGECGSYELADPTLIISTC